MAARLTIATELIDFNPTSVTVNLTDEEKKVLMTRGLDVEKIRATIMGNPAKMDHLKILIFAGLKFSIKTSAYDSIDNSALKAKLVNAVTALNVRSSGKAEAMVHKSKITVPQLMRCFPAQTCAIARMIDPKGWNADIGNYVKAFCWPGCIFFFTNTQLQTQVQTGLGAMTLEEAWYLWYVSFLTSVRIGSKDTSGRSESELIEASIEETKKNQRSLATPVAALFLTFYHTN
jgi:hypothetical protein